MSQQNRQDFTDKAANMAKPDSQKGYLESATDMAKGTMDSAMSTIQPESTKTMGQQAGDTVSSNQNENMSSMQSKAQGASNSMANTVAGTAQGTLDAAKDMAGVQR